VCVLSRLGRVTLGEADDGTRLAFISVRVDGLLHGYVHRNGNDGRNLFITSGVRSGRR